MRIKLLLLAYRQESDMMKHRFTSSTAIIDTSGICKFEIKSNCVKNGWKNIWPFYSIFDFFTVFLHQKDINARRQSKGIKMENSNEQKNIFRFIPFISYLNILCAHY